MNRQRIDQLHKVGLEYGQYVMSGKCSQGMFPPVWPEMTRKVKPCRRHRRTEMEKLGIPLTQPLSTRQRPSSKPLMQKTYPLYDKIHIIAVRQEELTKNIIVCLYYRVMSFKDISIISGLTSKQIGREKSRFLQAIDPIV